MHIEWSEDSHFPIQNIPFGIFSPLTTTATAATLTTTTTSREKRVGTRIGDFVIDLNVLANHGHFSGPILSKHPQIFSHDCLNGFMALGREAWKEARQTIQNLLKTNSSINIVKDGVVYRYHYTHVEMHLPCRIGDYTDFYASKEHATNVGTMFRGKDNALMPNWTYLPVGYHGRASSIVVSGTPITRPCGQRNAASKGDPPKVVYGPSIRMDFELEMAFFVGVGNSLGDQIPVDEADEHIFGVALLNDWSARDIQAWEYVPLGPFLGKNFATSISPWIVTLDALEPFFTDGPLQDPQPLSYLQEKSGSKTALDIKLQVSLKPKRKEGQNEEEEWNVISNTNLKYMYWSMKQQVAHHTVNGCNLQTGDVLGTGTISGPSEDSYGSMLELSWTGTKPLTLKNGEKRMFLEDGDELKLSGWAQGNGYRIGFGDCTGTILPSKYK